MTSPLILDLAAELLRELAHGFWIVMDLLQAATLAPLVPLADALSLLHAPIPAPRRLRECGPLDPRCRVVQCVMMRTATRLRNVFTLRQLGLGREQPEARMNGLIYLIGLIVVIMAILSLFGLR
jgi:hypothetical protein